jgi:hypothetical protein
MSKKKIIWLDSSVEIECCEDGTIRLSQPGLTQHIVDALRICDPVKFPRKFTPDKDILQLNLEGEPANGCYSYSSVVGMLQYIKAIPDLTSPSQFPNVPDTHTAQNNPMIRPWNVWDNI